MENLKVCVKNELESKEAQELLFELGYNYYFKGKTICNTDFGLVTANEDGLMAAIEVDGFEYEEVTLKHLRDLVVLKRNSIDDAVFKDAFGDIWYVDSTNSYWMFENDIWREAEEPLFKLEPIKKDGEVKMKEYLEPSNSYSLIKAHRKEGNDWIEVPEGAEIAAKSEGLKEVVFYKENGEYQFDKKWIECGFDNGVIHHNLKFFLDCDKRNKIVWQRNPTTPNTLIQDKLKFIEKWLNGEKIHYILGIETDKSKWHNFTEGAMQYIKRSDIKFREAPKYVTINGIEFKSVEKLVKYVKNNFDLEDGDE